jgi:hypothetical protein
MEPGISGTTEKDWDWEDISRLQDIRRQELELKNKKTGYYSTGKEDPTDPHMFNKKAYVPRSAGRDPQVAFYKKCAELNGENPYLPFVYYIDVEQGKSLERSSYRMESLVHMQDIGVEALVATTLSFARKFIPEDQKYFKIPKIKQDFAQYQTEEFPENAILEEKLKAACETAIVLLVDSVVGGISPTSDGNLKQAAAIIKEILETNWVFELDIHEQNIMLRRMKFGYQIVLVDPLS